jgi:N-acetylneuraminic acid mutarotase
MSMHKYYLFILFLVISCTEKLALHEPVTNNAVASLEKDGHTVFYSFYGLDSTKRASGVHNKIFRVDPATGESLSVGTLPDLGRLASSASVINNKAYVVGGYAVFENGKEKSSDQLFIFHPETEEPTRGAALPIPIDDQVQGVWAGQLLYVISGWTDSLNTNAVQVYNPKDDQWQLATPMPDEPGAKVFGGSGLIVGDTIYVLGGATFAKFFPPSRSFYKGAIDPSNPLHITWLSSGEYPGEFRYRSAAFLRDNKVVFAGGSNETYNYNGLSYSEKKPVEPNKTKLVYDPGTGRMKTEPSSLQTMDLRGVVLDAQGNAFTFGGMSPNQKVRGELRKLEEN